MADGLLFAGQRPAQNPFQIRDEIGRAERAACVGAATEGFRVRVGIGGPQVLAPQGRVPDLPPRLHLQGGVGAVGFAVRGGAGPGVIVRMGCHSCPDRVKLGVAQGRPEARRIERAGVEIGPIDVPLTALRAIHDGARSRAAIKGYQQFKTVLYRAWSELQSGASGAEILRRLPASQRWAGGGARRRQAHLTRAPIAPMGGLFLNVPEG